MKFLMLLLELHDSLEDTKGHVQDEVIGLICWKYLEGVKKSKDIYDITKLWNVFLCIFWSFSLWEVALSGIVLLVMGLR